jgi:hypothetical protein
VSRHRGGTASATRWVKETRFTVPGVSRTAAKAIMFALSDYVDERWSTYAGEKRLAAESDTSARTVRRFLAGAEAAGYLCRTRTGDDTHEGRAGVEQRAYLHVDGATDLCPCADDQPANLTRPTGQPDPTNRPDRLDLPASPGSKRAAAPSPTGTQGEPMCDDPLRRAAHRLAVLAFEQPVKPTIAGDDRKRFVAVLGLIEKALRAGRSVQLVEQAIVAGVDVWTTQGLNTALAKLRVNGRAAQRERGQDALLDALAEEQARGKV